LAGKAPLEGIDVTYREYRAYGYISRLGEIKATGGANQSISTGKGITQQQLGVASGAGTQAADLYNQYKTLTQPLISQETALATGDRNASLTAAQPVISQLSSGFQAAKQRIMNSVPPGAARDKALADLQTQYSSTIGGTEAQLVQQAPGVLAGIGGQSEGFGLQALGAQLNALAGGATTNFNTGQLAVAQQSSLLDFFGSLAGVAGGAISPISKLFSGGSPAGSTSGGINV
jgi:hypothetical protein